MYSIFLFLEACEIENQSHSTVLSSQKHKPKQIKEDIKKTACLKLWDNTTPQATDPLQFVKNTRLIQMLLSAMFGLNLIVAVLHQVTSSAWLLIHSYKPALITHNCLAALKTGFNHTFHSLCLFLAQARVITGSCLCTLYTIHTHNRRLSCRMHIRYSDTKMQKSFNSYS